MNEKKSGGYSGCGCSGFLLIVLAGLPLLFFARNFSPDVEDPQSTELPSAPNTIASPAKSKIVAPPRDQRENTASDLVALQQLHNG